MVTAPKQHLMTCVPPVGDAIVQLDGALRPQTLAGATVEESLDAGGFAASVTLLLCMVRGMDGV